MTHRLLAALGTLFIAMLGLPHFAVADDTTAGAGDTAKTEEEVPLFSLSRLSGTVQADFTNAYFFRGIRQERDGFIFEPWGELYYNLLQSPTTAPIRDITIGAGVWNSFHTEETGHAAITQEPVRDGLVPDRLGRTPARNLTLTTIYYFYTSPNDAFRTVQELNFKLAWDDSEALGKFALAPWINLAVETHKTSFGPNKGEGLQMGVAPTLYTIPLERLPDHAQRCRSSSASRSTTTTSSAQRARERLRLLRRRRDRERPAGLRSRGARELELHGHPSRATCSRTRSRMRTEGIGAGGVHGKPDPRVLIRRERRLTGTGRGSDCLAGAGAPRPAPSSPTATRRGVRRAAAARPRGSRSARRRRRRAARSAAALPGRPGRCR